MVHSWSNKSCQRSLWAIWVAIRAAKFQSVTTKMLAVTAEATGSSPVVPAIHFRAVINSPARGRLLTQGDPFQSFKGIGISADQKDERGCLGIRLCTPLFPLFQGPFVDP